MCEVAISNTANSAIWWSELLENDEIDDAACFTA